MNFNIAVQDLYFPDDKAPKLDYNTVFKGIVEEIPNIRRSRDVKPAPSGRNGDLKPVSQKQKGLIIRDDPSN